jgi:RNA polymerase sigma factor (sigma-70 family)
MSSAQVGAVLRHIRRLAAAREDPEPPDHQLLGRFARDRDEAAFAALLRRHGPMVLRVCRGVLHDLHDAEDAFQAAFVLLARKAGSIHRREAVSGWLYRVAYRVAVRARANTARRKVLEQRAVPMPPADPVLDMSLREVQDVLFEELEGLPEQYRAPLVLCALEEKPLEEAARLLGWTRGAVKGRLQRGREALRARLRRRGIDLPVTLAAAALALHSASNPVSATLVDSTLRAALTIAAGNGAAAGGVSAKVAALVQGASRTMFSGKTKIVTALLLAVSAAATAFGIIRLRASAADPPAPAPGKVERSQGAQYLPPAGPRARPGAEPGVEVRGRVLDPDGKPVAGAKLYVARTTLEGRALAEQAASGPDGRFRFAVARSEVGDGGAGDFRNPWVPQALGSVSEALFWPPEVMAVAEGHGCAWAELGPAAQDLTLRLVPDVPISGRVLDPDGRPVAGARVTVTGVSEDPKGLGSYLDAVRKGTFGYPFARGWAGRLAGQPAVRTTGADGRFKLAGVGRERIAYLRVEGPGIATADLQVMTRAAEPVTGPRPPGPVAVEPTRVYGASFDYVAAASRPIRGTVRDKDPGKPLAGMRVRLVSGVGPRGEAVSDTRGRYEFAGLRKAPRYALEVIPPDGLYLQRSAEVNDVPGLDVLNGDVDMVRGAVTVRGKVTDKKGKPVAARVEYFPLYGNADANTRLAGVWHPHSGVITGSDGSYALTVLPGPGVLGVTALRDWVAYMPGWVTLKERHDFFKTPLPTPLGEDEATFAIAAGGTSGAGFSQGNYHAVVLLDPDAKDKELVRNVVLEPALELKGRVVGPDGQPVTGVMALGLGRYGEETLKGAEFTVRGVNPKQPRQLLFRQKDRNLGFLLKELPRDPSAPLTVRLQRCGSASGRVVDQDGQPAAGFRLQVWRMRSANAGMGTDRQLVTDKDGRFRAEGLVPGQDYGVVPPRQGIVHVTVGPGEHKDLGDIRVPLDK